MRGGDSSTTIDVDHDTASAAESDIAKEKSDLFSIGSMVGSLFRSYNDVKADASRAVPTITTPDKTRQVEESRVSSSQRGGAFVPTPPTPKRPWFALPFQSNRAASLQESVTLDPVAELNVASHINNVEDGTNANTFEKRNRSNNKKKKKQTPTAEAVMMQTEAVTEDVVSKLDESTVKLHNPKKSKERGTNTKERRDKQIRVVTPAQPEVSPDVPAENTSSAFGSLDVMDGININETVSDDNIVRVDLPSSAQIHDEVTEQNDTQYTSAGFWSFMDSATTFGYSQSYPRFRISRQLRGVRKATAKLTGFHGLLSGKNRTEEVIEEEERRGAIRRRVAAISRAKENVERLTEEELAASRRKKGFFSFFTRRKEDEFKMVLDQDEKAALEEKKRRARVMEIDKLMFKKQQQLQDLACEKDVLQQRHNPLWNYTVVDKVTGKVVTENLNPDNISSSRRFNFPPPDLVDEYLEVLFASNRLVRLNHTDLWRHEDDDMDYDDDELASVTQDEAFALRHRSRDYTSGSWLLRHGFGEKIGLAAENAGYKSVCAAIMSVLARLFSNLHGLNIMGHSDIRLFVEQVPDLPPLAAGITLGSGGSMNYARGAIERAILRGAQRGKRYKHRQKDDPFIQRDFVVETLLSHCQISAPLLKLFPLIWQRALLSNLVTLITAVVSDFFEGIEFYILGHRLCFNFSPIRETDMLHNMGPLGEGFNRHRASNEEFEAAVKATADDLAEELKFLDRWHERALGSGMLRMQIANLIARLVLTLIDDALSGARMDFWAAHAGGPRLVAGLEYRTDPSHIDKKR